MQRSGPNCGSSKSTPKLFQTNIAKNKIIENRNISCSISFPIDSSNTEFAYYGPILVNCFVSVCQSEKNGGNLVGLVNQLMTF